MDDFQIESFGMAKIPTGLNIRAANKQIILKANEFLNLRKNKLDFFIVFTVFLGRN